MSGLKIDGVEGSVRMLLVVLQGSAGPARDVVVINSAAALLAADRVATLRDGAALAAESIDSGSALSKLDALVALSQTLE
jgi:anthranilate phosphoribosyltransferase